MKVKTGRKKELKKRKRKGRWGSNTERKGRKGGRNESDDRKKEGIEKKEEKKSEREIEWWKKTNRKEKKGRKESKKVTTLKIFLFGKCLKLYLFEQTNEWKNKQTNIITLGLASIWRNRNFVTLSTPITLVNKTKYPVYEYECVVYILLLSIQGNSL